MFWIFIIIIAIVILIQILRTSHDTSDRKFLEDDPDRIRENERAKTNSWFSG